MTFTTESDGRLQPEGPSGQCDAGNHRLWQRQHAHLPVADGGRRRIHLSNHFYFIFRVTRKLGKKLPKCWKKVAKTVAKLKDANICIKAECKKSKICASNYFYSPKIATML
jgi:hypothetical protein